MIRKLLLMIWLGSGMISVVSAQVAFTRGNIVIYRVGDGSVALTATARPVFLDEYTTSGTLVQSIALPTAVSGSNLRLTASGTANMGWITRSVNGQYLVVTGYNAALNASVSTSSAATVNRTIGLIDYTGNVNTATAFTDYASIGQPLSAITTTGTGIWAVGTTNGARYATSGGVTATTQLAPSPTNLKALQIVDNQLYVSMNTGGVATIGIGLPTTGGQTITPLPGLPTTGGAAFQFVMFDMDAGVAGPDVLYIADALVGLQKFSLVGGTWTANGIVGGGSDSYKGVTARVNGSTVALYATRLNSELVSIVDVSGYNGTITATPTLLATAGTNTVFRGVALAPVDPLTLPVKLTSFAAKKDGDAVDLDWSTSSEVNFSHFEVERSEDGVNFTKIGTVNGTPGNRTVSYHYMDQSIGNLLRSGGVLYYRLMMVDRDGNFEHSKIVVVKSNPELVELENIYPNPFISEVHIKLYLQNATDANIILLDAVGRQVGPAMKLHLVKGENKVKIGGLHIIAKGLYLLRINAGEYRKIIRLVK